MVKELLQPLHVAENLHPSREKATCTRQTRRTSSCCTKTEMDRPTGLTFQLLLMTLKVSLQTVSQRHSGSSGRRNWISNIVLPGNWTRPNFLHLSIPPTLISWKSFGNFLYLRQQISVHKRPLSLISTS